MTHPRYVAMVRSTWEPTRVLAYMADFRHAAEWDPSVEAAILAGGNEAPARGSIGPGTAFDLTVRVGRRVSSLRYVVTAMAPNSVKLTARTRSLESVDTITVTANPTGGSDMVYDARLTFLGLARVANPLLARTLRRLGDNAAAGLNQQLNR